MNYYASDTSIVRRIWGKADTILLIFAGAAAEFALNKAVDWLYYTGRLPSDPLGRLFSTVTYAREIIFTSTDKAHAAVDRMRSIHQTVESSRGYAIPDAAYRDVLFMLIHYSISAYEVLERKLTAKEKEEVVQVFLKVAHRMQIKGLPHDFPSWLAMYHDHQKNNLRYSPLTTDLFKQYRKHLGLIRYRILIESQKLVVSAPVRELLHFNRPLLMKQLVKIYGVSRFVGADKLLKELLLPPMYKQRIKALDQQHKSTGSAAHLSMVISAIFSIITGLFI